MCYALSLQVAFLRDEIRFARGALCDALCGSRPVAREARDF
jgi:hypothetical protein